MWARSLYYLKKVFDTVKYSSEETGEFQQRCLEEIMDTCRELPFYKNHWPEEVNPDRSLEVPPQLPIIDSKQLRNLEVHMDDALQSEDLVSRHTSGTSGNRTEVAFTDQADDWLSAIHTRTLYYNGYRPRQHIAQLWHRSPERTWLGKKLIPVTYIDTDNSLEEQVKLLAENNPDVLDYFPQTLLSLCKHLNRNGSLEHIQPERIFTRGGLLTPSMRQYIEETFDAPVYDIYVATEFGVIAWQCGDGGYHIAEDSVYAEILDSDSNCVSPGETGRIILTGLVNTATPLARYEIGDVVENAENFCSCETSFKRVQRIRGRREEVFISSEGDPIYPDEVVEMIAPCEDILFYQLAVDEDRYVLQYVPNDGFDREQVEQCAERLTQDLSLKPLDLKKVSAIPRSSGGKLKVIENNQE